MIGMTLDFERDLGIVNHNEIKLFCTKSGHYCIPISVIGLEDTNVVLHAQNLYGYSSREKKSKALKLHRQFAHASYEKLHKLLTESGCKDREFEECLKQVCSECPVCQKYKRPPLRPVVGLRLADRFNKVVCIDLKEFNKEKGEWILHRIDSATRYSAADLIVTKKTDVVVSSIFMDWFRYFGAARKILTDNGGDFPNNVMIEMNEKFGIETLVTAAESPWSNSIVERHHARLYEAMMKTIKDTRCEPKIGLAWSVCAKNALCNKDVFFTKSAGVWIQHKSTMCDNRSPPALEG